MRTIKQWLPEFVLRLTLAGLFVQSGLTHVAHVTEITQSFWSLGIPMPHLAAKLVALAEVGSGLLLVIGPLARLAYHLTSDDERLSHQHALLKFGADA